MRVLEFGRRHTRSIVSLLMAGITLMLGVSWTLASHPGSSPDSTFHLSSIWCAWGTDATGCAKGEIESGQYMVSVPSLEEAVSQCIPFAPEESAACIAKDDEQSPPFAWRANAGSYPPGYYAAARALVSADAERSILLIRIATFVLSMALIVAAGMLLGLGDRWRTWWFLGLLCVPVALFFFSSTNPSGPAIAGCIAVAVASYAIGHGKRAPVPAVSVGLAGALTASLSRPDGWQFAVLALGLGALASVQSLPSVLSRPRVVGWLILMLPLIVAWALQPGPATLGYRPDGASGQSGPGVSPFEIVLEIPRLYVGEYATRLGWMDTSLPALAWGSAALVLGGVVLAGVAEMSRYRAVALGVAALALVLAPSFMHLSVGYPVGAWVQPRYLLPLVMTTAVLLAVRPRGRSHLQAAQVVVLSGLAVVGHAWALHRTIRRSVTGIDSDGGSLSAGAEWWWDMAMGPDAIWIIGAVAYLLIVAFAGYQVLRHQSPGEPPPEGDEPGIPVPLLGERSADRDVGAGPDVVVAIEQEPQRREPQSTQVRITDK